MSDTALVLERQGTHLIRYVDTYDQNIYLHRQNGQQWQYFGLTPDEFAAIAEYVKEQGLVRPTSKNVGANAQAPDAVGNDKRRDEAPDVWQILRAEDGTPLKRFVEDDGYIESLISDNKLTIGLDDLAAINAHVAERYPDAVGVAQPQPPVPDEVAQAMDQLLSVARWVVRDGSYTADSRRRELLESSLKVADAWRWGRRDSLPTTTQPSQPDWMVTPDEWARLGPEYVCAAVDPGGKLGAFTSGIEPGRNIAKVRQWVFFNDLNGKYRYLRTVTLPADVRWQDTLHWRPGHEPKDDDA